MEKYSETQIYKNKPGTRNGSVNADILEPFALSLVTVNGSAIANVG